MDRWRLGYKGSRAGGQSSEITAQSNLGPSPVTSERPSEGSRHSSRSHSGHL